jgi:hypothetical protein
VFLELEDVVWGESYCTTCRVFSAHAAEATRFSLGASFCFVCFMDAACTAVRAIVVTMSSTVHPRLRSFTGFLKPCSSGPIATAPVDCITRKRHSLDDLDSNFRTTTSLIDIEPQVQLQMKLEANINCSSNICT